MRLTRTGIVYAVVATIGFALLIWLLAFPSTDKKFYQHAGVTLECSSPLAEEANDQTFDRQGKSFRDPNFFDTTEQCAKIRTRSLSWAVLLAIPTTVAAALAVARIEKTTRPVYRAPLG